MNPELGEYATKVRKLMQYSTIVVATNGLLIEKSSDENLKNWRMQMSWSALQSIHRQELS